MCLAVIAVDAHPRYALVIAANRDEYHARPSVPAHWWSAGHATPLLAGRDLEHGGTWLGVARDGRFAFVTNVREPGRHDARAPSRGVLVPRLLGDPRPIGVAMQELVAGARGYNGYNLVAADAAGAVFGSNRGPQSVPLGAGLHGVSNAGLDTPWPKLVRAKAGLAAWIASGSDAPAALWPVLADRTPAADDALPQTGLSRERERLLSSPFIVSDTYGTRCSTLVAMSRDGTVDFIERRFDADGALAGEVAYRFASQPGVRSPAAPSARSGRGRAERLDVTLRDDA
jgi:uncharacterized protein with NRDE domain